MTRSGLTTRDVGRAVGLDHSAVARWLKGGTVPYRSSLAKLATHFDVSVEDLTDDTRELPIETRTTLLAEDQIEYDIATAPIKTAAALAHREHGDTPAGQSAFEKHLANLRSMRDEAERQNPQDASAAARQLDTLLASYIAALDTRH